MKKYLFLFCLLANTSIYGQTTTVRTQYLNANLWGLHYNFEEPVTAKTTINYHGGLAGELLYSSGTWVHSDDFSYSFRASFGADFRYYYNLAKRRYAGKSTFYNSGNFLALDMQYFTPAFNSKNVSKSYMIMASPYWGIRNVSRSSWLYELNLGVNAGVRGGNWGWNPKVDVKLGYVF